MNLAIGLDIGAVLLETKRSVGQLQTGLSSVARAESRTSCYQMAHKKQVTQSSTRLQVAVDRYVISCYGVVCLSKLVYKGQTCISWTFRTCRVLINSPGMIEITSIEIDLPRMCLHFILSKYFIHYDNTFSIAVPLILAFKG